MRQYDVYENPSVAARRYAPFLVVLQSHLLEGLDSVILAPLVIDSRKPVSAIDVIVEFEGETYVLGVSELASVLRNVMKRRRGSLGAYSDAISLAMNRVMVGF